MVETLVPKKGAKSPVGDKPAEIGAVALETLVPRQGAANTVGDELAALAGDLANHISPGLSGSVLGPRVAPRTPVGSVLPGDRRQSPERSSGKAAVSDSKDVPGKRGHVESQGLDQQVAGPGPVAREVGASATFAPPQSRPPSPPSAE